MPKRLLTWGIHNAFLASLTMNLALVLVMGAGILHEGKQRADEIAVESRRRAAALVLESEERARQDAVIAVETCKAVVRTVTAQSKADDQAIVDVIKQRFAETGRPVPAIYLALEATIAARQAPVAACEP